MIETILFILAVVIIYFILHRVTKSLIMFKVVFRLVSVALVIILAIVIVTGFLVLNDANNFRKNFSNSTNLYILEENNTLLSGIVINNTDAKPFKVLSLEDLNKVDDDYNHNRISRMTQGYYKVFIVDMNAISDLDFKGITNKNIDLSKDQVIEILRSKTPKKELARIVAGNEGAIAQDVLDKMTGMNDLELKGYLFSYALTSFFNPRDMDVFLVELKNGNIRVYEETAMFKAIRIVPKFLVVNIVNKQQNNATTDIFKAINMTEFT